MVENIFDIIIETLAERINFFFFVQIGACDGIISDPIHKFINKYKNWKGIFVEPQKKEFEKLKEIYKHRNFIFENVAISDKKGVKGLYKPKEELIDADWKKGIASLTPEKNFMKNYIKNNEYEIEIVKCITFQDLIKKHNVRKIDLLIIDVEGHESKILDSINLNETKPRIIYYEKRNLTPEEKSKIQKKLKEDGYMIIEDKFDTIALLNLPFLRLGKDIKSIFYKIKIKLLKDNLYQLRK